MDMDLFQPISGPSNPATLLRGQHAPTVQVQFDLDDLANLEQHFYDTGHLSGLAHGRIHGLIEGRELGREKGFDLWEEVGFYEGFGKAWRALLAGAGGGAGSGTGTGTGEGRVGGGEAGRARALQSVARLLALVDRFPTTNPTPSADPPSTTPEDDLEPDPAAQGTDNPPENVDMTALLARIRAQYRTLCSALGVRPRLAVAQNAGAELGKKLAF
ncbi:hypothetical protein CALCODRAFT_482738 [Calocera cornea HHB12733]|uniref:Essential protein Yae1 N-terminal domain-containing protein n=1 Tax=Calocera cornea HHB12733 TaxID=1353952 RepID=A0A165GGK8_9BASI|nr:hypothetical protein CALCODRAFT_482738 [Calocera cornea HHB12733]